MCLVFMSFRAPSSALKQKNYHNSPNMPPIITLFQVLFKFNYGLLEKLFHWLAVVRTRGDKVQSTKQQEVAFH